jgi:hypothetical protein
VRFREPSQLGNAELQVGSDVTRIGVAETLNRVIQGIFLALWILVQKAGFLQRGRDTLRHSDAYADSPSEFQQSERIRFTELE